MSMVTLEVAIQGQFGSLARDLISSDKRSMYRKWDTPSNDAT